MFSASEMIVVGVLALILIGPKQLPEVARTLGRLIADLKRTANGFTSEFKSEMDREIAKNNSTANSTSAIQNKIETPSTADRFILRYEDGTPMRPEDRVAEGLPAEAEVVVDKTDKIEKKDEPS